MKLRIIAGELRHRLIQVPDTVRFRPTLERVRQSVAESVKPLIPGARVVDLCSGSGAFGFEMLSRGAARVYFVEQNRILADCIVRHARLFKVEERCRVRCGDMRRFLASSDKGFDIVFYDPPYDDPALTEILPACVGLLADEGIMLYQREKESPGAAVSIDAAAFRVETRVYGRTMVDFIRRA
jgi:16S rRNA (guanine966-N2)-methyltransferase